VEKGAEREIVSSWLHHYVSLTPPPSHSSSMPARVSTSSRIRACIHAFIIRVSMYLPSCPFIHLSQSIHLFIRSLVKFLTHLLTCSPTQQSLTLPLTHVPTHSLSHPCTDTSVHPSTRPSNYALNKTCAYSSFNPSIFPYTHTSIRLSIHPSIHVLAQLALPSQLTHSLIHQLLYSLYSCIHPYQFPPSSLAQVPKQQSTAGIRPTCCGTGSGT
jgi:hypothetical protein